MKYKEIIKNEIKNILQKIIVENSLDIDVNSINFEITIPDLKFGDYSCNVCLTASKVLKKSPKEIFETLIPTFSNVEGVEQIQNTKINFIEKIDFVNPGFLNIWIKKEFILDNVKNFGKEKLDHSQKEKFVIEHTSPNPNKAMHLGHLRNNLIGMALGRLLKGLGNEVVLDMVDNNRGIAIAKGMWGLKIFGKEIEKENLSSDKFAEKLYVIANKEFEENKQVENEIREIALKWEEGEDAQPEIWQLWREYLNYVYAGQERTLERLGNHWDYKWHEHEHYKKGKDIVMEGLRQGIFKKSEGAIVTDLEKFNLPDTVLLKQDGTALYMTQDLALTKLKIEKYGTDKLFWVIGPEQSLQMKQLFCLCDQLGFGKRENFNHISYGYVYLKNQEGKKEKMSSRKGNVYTIDDLIDEVKEKLVNKIGYRVEESEKDKLAEVLALGAIKFSILKVARSQDIVFDIDESINLNGDSGPYIQYTFARINSLLEKATTKSPQTPLLKRGSIEEIKNNEVIEILRFVLQYKNALEESSEELGVQKIAQYILQLSHKFNLLYTNNQIIGSENEEEFLFVANVIKNVLKNGLSILGIEAPERM